MGDNATSINASSAEDESAVPGEMVFKKVADGYLLPAISLFGLVGNLLSSHILLGHLLRLSVN